MCSKFEKPTVSTKRFSRRKQIRRQYHNLQKLIPATNFKNKVSKVSIINEAIAYIEILEQELINKLANLQSSRIKTSNLTLLPIGKLDNLKSTKSFSRRVDCKILSAKVSQHLPNGQSDQLRS